MSFWQRISNAGVTESATNETNRNIILCNRVSFLLACFILALGLVAFLFFGFIASTTFALLFPLVALLPIVLNANGHTNAARIFLWVAINVACIVTSILDKFDYRQLE